MAERGLIPESRSAEYEVESILETSVSRLYFTKDFVYKRWLHHHDLIEGLEYIPVRFNYLNGEVDKGRDINKDCQEDVYLGVMVVEFIQDGDSNTTLREVPQEELSLRLRQGDLTNWDAVLKMKRFPQERGMKEMLLADGNVLQDQHVADAVEKIINYNQRLDQLPSDKKDEINENVDQVIAKTFSFDFLKNTLSPVLDVARVSAVQAGTVGFLADNKEMLQQRVDCGLVKIGHGDTKILNIFVGNGTVGDRDKCYFLDAIAFKDEWCLNDLLSELAYFLVYFNFYKPEEFDYWFNVVDQKYQEMTGNDSLFQDPLFWFYLNYRAMVQAKVAAIEVINEPQDSAKIADKTDEANEFLALAEKYLAKAQELSLVKPEQQAGA